MAGVQCPAPLVGWRSRRVNPTGKRSITFNIRDGLQDEPVEVPCGKCDICIAKAAREWGTRAYYESKGHEQNCFLTLTYDDRNYPKDGKLDKRELQRFTKRLRKVTGVPIRYLACGEYGEKTERAHYHMVVFGSDLRGGAVDVGDWYFSPVVRDTWGLGNIHTTSLEPGACYYVAGYTQKKGGKGHEFRLASRRPPLGRQAACQFKEDFRKGYITIDGKLVPVPKAFREWDEEVDRWCKDAKLNADAERKQRDWFGFWDAKPDNVKKVENHRHEVWKKTLGAVYEDVM